MINHFFLATCQECQPVLPMPFANAHERAKWIIQHTDATQHHVTLSEEVRL